MLLHPTVRPRPSLSASFPTVTDLVLSKVRNMASIPALASMLPHLRRMKHREIMLRVKKIRVEG